MTARLVCPSASRITLIGVTLARELCGVGVAQPVGVHAPVDPGAAREARQQMADIGGVDAAAGQRAEHRRAGTRREGSPAVKPAGQQRGGLLVDADRPGLVALAVAHPERPGLEI